MTTVQQYFASKASHYDDVDLQPYWVFSDELLWYLLTKNVLPKDQQQPFRFLDAGAGTARWSSRILREYEHAEAHLVDLSSEMLAVAREKFSSQKDVDRVDIQVGDVRQITHIKEQSIDFVICLHNVIGFFEDTHNALRQFYALLKKGGKCAVMFPSFYHALYFSNATGRSEEIERIRNERHVRYNDVMPSLKVFEIGEIEKLQSDAGFHSVTCYGFPVTVYPGMAETFLHGSTEKLASLFSEPYRSQLGFLERQLCLQPVLAPRGNNLLAIFEKA